MWCCVHWPTAFRCRFPCFSGRGAARLISGTASSPLSLCVFFPTRRVGMIVFEGKRQPSCFMHSLFSSISRSRRCRKTQLDSSSGFYVLQRHMFHAFIRRRSGLDHTPAHSTLWRRDGKWHRLKTHGWRRNDFLGQLIIKTMKKHTEQQVFVCLLWKLNHWWKVSKTRRSINRSICRHADS